jgi:hypothetical protein
VAVHTAAIDWNPVERRRWFLPVHDSLSTVGERTVWSECLGYTAIHDVFWPSSPTYRGDQPVTELASSAWR